MNWTKQKIPKGLPKSKRHKPKFSFSMDKQNKIVEEARKRGRTITHIIGVDEVAWGAISGPLTLGCVVLKVDQCLNVKDSKAYSTEKARKKAAKVVEEKAEDHYVYSISSYRLNQIGPSVARDSGMDYLISRAYAQYPNSLAIIDGNYVPSSLQGLCIAVPKADSHIQAVSSASVIAKVTRDEYMRVCGDEYEFFKNKGYPTPRHLELLKKLGPCSEHRVYTKSVREILHDKKED